MKTQKNKNKNQKETDEDRCRIVRGRRGRVMAGEDGVLKNDAIVIVLDFVNVSRFFNTLFRKGGLF